MRVFFTFVSLKNAVDPRLMFYGYETIGEKNWEFLGQSFLANCSKLFLICCYTFIFRCSSFIGRIRGSQELSLADSCLVEDVIIHEFVHALGFFHEQSRPDRDDFIQVFLDRVKIGKLPSLHLCLLHFTI